VKTALGERSFSTVNRVEIDHLNGAGADPDEPWQRRRVATRRSFRVLSEHAGLRLDQAISIHLSDISRALARRVLSEGGVFVDKKRVKIAGRSVRAGQAIDVFVESERSSAATDAPLELTVLLETADYVVVDKPTGMFSAPTPATDQKDVLAALDRRDKAAGQSGEYFLVHRLDRPTSGLMLVAKNKGAAAHLSEQVAARRMKRRYEAFLLGSLTEEVSVTTPVEQKEAHTDFAPLRDRAGITWVSAELGTGRMHQVRIHATSLGMPVLGDSKYGRSLARRAPLRPPRLALHAAELTFIDPSTRQVIRLDCPMPPDLLDYWKRLPEPAGDC